MRALPTELWLIIFDLVIEEGIIGVDKCTYTKFPHIQSILPTAPLRYWFYDSYHQLRLVCWSFRAILSDPHPPSQILSPSSIFPLSTAIRALVLNLDAWSWSGTNFQLPSAELLLRGRLVYLDVTCGLLSSSPQPSLSDFLCACAGQAFHKVQRLTLRIVNHLSTPHEESAFWARLYDAFPWLVTLVITQENPDGGHVMLDAAARVVSFESLKILYLGRAIKYAGCRFPHLRHASIGVCSDAALEILTVSPHLESLLIRSDRNRSDRNRQINVNSCSRLKLLGIHAAACDRVNPLKGAHPLEHLWVFIYDRLRDYRSLKDLLKRLPRISRVTIELSSSINEKGRIRITQDLKAINLVPIGMNMRPPVHGDSPLVIERSPASIRV
jgi:hypothetical protein